MLPEPNYPARPEQFIGRRDQIEAFEEALRYSTVTRRMASFAVLGERGDRQEQQHAAPLQCDCETVSEIGTGAS